MFEISSGKIKTALKVVVYGPEGIGKSTFASQFPDPVFIDTEGSTKHMEVKRFPSPSSWSMLLQEVQQVKTMSTPCKTLVVDTADWAEQLCIAQLCAQKGWGGIEDAGWGKGYTYLVEEFGKLLNQLEDIVRCGINVVVTAHAQMRKFEQPDELGSYDRWELKLQKKTAPMVKEWADIVLFANYQTFVINVDNQGASKGKNKAQGGKRIMYTSHHPCWDAKNRQGLAEQLPFEFKEISHLFNINLISHQTSNPVVQPTTQSQPQLNQPLIDIKQGTGIQEGQLVIPSQAAHIYPPVDYTGIPQSLVDLMKKDHVSPEEIQAVVADKAYYPKVTPISNYDPGFIEAVLVAAWPNVLEAIKFQRSIPF